MFRYFDAVRAFLEAFPNPRSDYRFLAPVRGSGLDHCHPRSESCDLKELGGCQIHFVEYQSEVSRDCVREETASARRCSAN